MDSLKNRYYIRFLDEGKEYRLPLSKGRTVLRVIFRMFFGDIQYMEIANEAYLDKRVFKKKKDKNGNLVRGYGDSKRIELFGKSHERQINEFREGLSDPETKEGYETPYLTIRPFTEEQLDDCMTFIEEVSADTFVKTFKE